MYVNVDILSDKKRERTPTISPDVTKRSSDSDDEAPSSVKKRKRIRLNPVDSDDSDVENKGKIHYLFSASLLCHSIKCEKKFLHSLSKNIFYKVKYDYKSRQAKYTCFK